MHIKFYPQKLINFNPFTTTVPMYISLSISILSQCNPLMTLKRTPDSSTNVHMYINPFTTEYIPVYINHSWELECISIECTQVHLLVLSIPNFTLIKHEQTVLQIFLINPFTTRILAILYIIMSIPANNQNVHGKYVYSTLT